MHSVRFEGFFVYPPGPGPGMEKGFSGDREGLPLSELQQGLTWDNTVKARGAGTAPDPETPPSSPHATDGQDGSPGADRDRFCQGPADGHHVGAGGRPPGAPGQLGLHSSILAQSKQRFP